MSEGLRSILLGTSVLWVALAVSVVLAFVRPAPSSDTNVRAQLQQLFLLGIAAQCVHTIEEFITGFYVSWPRLLGLAPWSAEFFVVFNLAWIAVWVLAAVALREGLPTSHGLPRPGELTSGGCLRGGVVVSAAGVDSPVGGLCPSAAVRRGTELGLFFHVGQERQ